MATSDHTTIPIQLNRGYVATVDECDADLASFKWTALVKNNKVIAAHRCVSLPDGTQFTQLMHRVILARMLGRELVRGEQVDHIDNNGTNNCRGNLRLANNSQNQCNQGLGRNNTSGFKGVWWVKSRKKWRAGITAQGKQIHLGEYNTPEEAHEAYCIAAEKYHGEFRRTE